MKIPQFTTRDLLWCVTLIGAGMGCWPVAVYFGRTSYMLSNLGHVLAALVVGTVFIGAGLFAPFRAKCLGAAVGFGLGLLTVYCLLYIF